MFPFYMILFDNVFIARLFLENIAETIEKSFFQPYSGSCFSLARYVDVDYPPLVHSFEKIDFNCI